MTAPIHAATRLPHERVWCEYSAASIPYAATVFTACPEGKLGPGNGPRPSRRARTEPVQQEVDLAPVAGPEPGHPGPAELPVPERPHPLGVPSHPPPDGQDDPHHHDQQEQHQAEAPGEVLHALVAATGRVPE